MSCLIRAEMCVCLQNYICTRSGVSWREAQSEQTTTPEKNLKRAERKLTTSGERLQLATHILRILSLSRVFSTMAATSVSSFFTLEDNLAHWKTRTTILNVGEPDSKRLEILQYYKQTFALYEKLFELIKRPLGFFIKAEPLRHPLIFYYGHTACFYMNKLILGGYLEHRIDPDLENVCAVGVDEMSWDDWDVSHYEWPSESEAREDPERAEKFFTRVRDFRREVYKTVQKLILTGPLEIPVLKSSLFWVIMMGIEHERIHLETSSMIIRQMDITELHQDSSWIYCREGDFTPDPMLVKYENPLVAVSGGSVKQGRPWDETNHIYGWDNEFGSYKAEVAPFKVSTYLVTNREYLDFYNAGGYKCRQWWTEEGWAWVTSTKSEKPLVWIPLKGGKEWKIRLMANEVAMPWDWPVEVNYLEAKAFCNWKSDQMKENIRLLMTDEWCLLREMIEDDQPYWEKAPGNINLEYWASSCPVNKFKQTPLGLYDVVGNVWHHTETCVDIFDGFQVHPLYDDFTLPTVDGKHNEIKGGCWISTGNESCKSARYGFRRHFMQHAGFRYVQSDYQLKMEYTVPPEIEPYSATHLSLNYPSTEAGKAACYPKKFAELCLLACDSLEIEKDSAIELCCGAGRVSFELARKFQSVCATDMTARLFSQGDRLKTSGRVRWLLPEEGDLTSYHEARPSNFGLEELLDKVSFTQLDYQNPDYSKFKPHSLVCLSNMLENFSKPRVVLANAAKLLRTSKPSLLVVAFHGNWTTTKTAEEDWIGCTYIHSSSQESEGIELNGSSSVDTSSPNSTQPGATTPPPPDTYTALLKYMNESLGLVEVLSPETLILSLHKTGRRKEVKCMTVTFWMRGDAKLVGHVEAHQLKEAAHICPKRMDPGYQPCDNNYENNAVLNMYLDNHFDKEILFNVPKYPVVCAEHCKELGMAHLSGTEAGLHNKRVLEIGGGVGRVGFELARNFGEVVCTDYSETFINAALNIQKNKRVAYTVSSGGYLEEERSVCLADLGIDDEISKRVRFMKMDAMNLPPASELGGQFDLIFGGNLIDRLPRPKHFLAAVQSLLKPGGLLILSSPYTWLETWTRKSEWIGGFKKSAEDYNTIEGLRDFLSVTRSHDASGVHSYVEISPPRQIDFVIRESKSSFQKSVAELSVWKLLAN